MTPLAFSVADTPDALVASLTMCVILLSCPLSILDLSGLSWYVTKYDFCRLV